MKEGLSVDYSLRVPRARLRGERRLAQPSGPALHHLLAAGDVGLLWGATAHDGPVPFRLILDEVRMGHQYFTTWPVTTAKQVVFYRA